MDSIKVGGFASSGFYSIFNEPLKFGVPEKASSNELSEEMREYAKSPRAKHMLTFFFAFFDYMKQHGSPIDFFSWHSYDSVAEVEQIADFVDRCLCDFGFGHVETQLNEWNNAPKKELRGTSFASANAAAMMCAMQNKKTDILCYYDARIGQSVYGGLFNPITYEPFCTYYTFAAFGELYRLGSQAGVSGAQQGVVWLSGGRRQTCRADCEHFGKRCGAFHQPLPRYERIFARPGTFFNRNRPKPGKLCVKTKSGDFAEKLLNRKKHAPLRAVTGRV